MLQTVENSAPVRQVENARGSRLLATMDNLALEPQQEVSHSMFPMLKNESPAEDLTAQSLGQRERSGTN